MKKKLFLISLIAIVPLLLLGCSPETAVSVSCDDFMSQPNITKQVEVAANSSFTLTLCSNPTTGYTWSESATINEPAVLQQTDHKFVPPEDKDIAGAPGQEVWTFKALKSGTSTASFEYSRPWEGGEKGTWLFTLTVIVK